MSTNAGSATPSAERGRVRRVALVTHGRVGQVEDGVVRLVALAAAERVELLVTEDEAGRHGIPAHGDTGDAELVVVLGGDGTMLRALRTFLGTGVPVLGVNFGRVGFLSSLEPEELEDGLRRAFAGGLQVVELPTLEVGTGGSAHVAVNDVVVTSGEIGRMVELEWAVGGEDLGRVPCDGLICSTPSGSTAYNLSNGGPVLMWGIDALATTFVAPHSLHARPLVVPRAKDVVVWNRTPDVPVVVLVDGHPVGQAGRDESVTIRLGDARTLLASLPGATFVSRYRANFST
jgi:NAD+ kinase